MPMPLPLPKSERAAVFRALVDILRADPVLSGVVKTLLAWDGDPRDPTELTLGMAPAIRLTPTGQGDAWYSPASMVGALVVNCEILTAGYDVDDPTNLWRAVIAAIYAPSSPDVAFADIQARLRAAGAYPPSPQFTMPAFDPKPESNFCYGVAQIQVMVQVQLGSQGVNPT